MRIAAMGGGRGEGAKEGARRELQSGVYSSEGGEGGGERGEGGRGASLLGSLGKGQG